MIKALLLHPLTPALIAGATLAAAFGFQHIGGYAPCPLCVWQRWPHAAAIVLALLAWALPQGSRLRLGALILTGLTFAAGAALAGYHVGVEQRWWAGTFGCSSPALVGTDLDALRTQLFATPAVRCDEVPWSLFGLSMAGYNMLISLGLAVVAGLAARAGAADPRYGVRHGGRSTEAAAPR